jgi:ABC-2 type transport system ATP-binding protein
VTNAIEFTGATKSFGQVLAVDDLTAVAQPGDVTALLGPNGAGKTTTLRMLLGLVASSSGTATIGSLRYDELPDPVAVYAGDDHRPRVRPASPKSRAMSTLLRLPPLVRGLVRVTP